MVADVVETADFSAGEMAGQVKRLKVTPEMARVLLGRGGKNRPAKARRVSRYASDMKAGLWRFTGDTIKLDSAGAILDGQHRLLACVEADVPFETLLIYDIEADAFTVIDDGAARGLPDLLAIDGVSNYTSVAAALGWVWMYDKSALNFSQRPSGEQRGTKQQLLEFYHSGHKVRWDRAVVAGRKAKKLVGSKGIATACHFLFQRRSIAEAERFYEELVFGNPEKDSPLYHLRRRLLKDSYENPNLRLPGGLKMALIIKAWRAFVDGKPMKMLKIMDKEPFPQA